MDGDRVPGRFCHICGEQLIAINLDVGYAELFCPYCDLKEAD